MKTSSSPISHELLSNLRSFCSQLFVLSFVEHLAQHTSGENGEQISYSYKSKNKFLFVVPCVRSNSLFLLSVIFQILSAISLFLFHTLITGCQCLRRLCTIMQVSLNSTLRNSCFMYFFNRAHSLFYIFQEDSRKTFYYYTFTSHFFTFLKCMLLTESFRISSFSIGSSPLLLWTNGLLSAAVICSSMVVIQSAKAENVDNWLLRQLQKCFFLRALFCKQYEEADSTLPKLAIFFLLWKNAVWIVFLLQWSFLFESSWGNDWRRLILLCSTITLPE